MGTVEWIRVTPARPCPVCARTHYCSVSADGGLVYCTKVPSDRPGTDGVGWIHTAAPPARANGHARAAGATTRYGVLDANGVLVAVHCRVDLAGGGKRIWWTLPDGTKGLGGRKPETLPLYGADQLAGAPAGATVFVCEGEKAADALASLGVPAVGTVTGAAAMPGADALRDLVGFDVVLWPDNDDPGRTHMRAVASGLRALGVGPRVLTWPDAPAKGDAADFVAAGLGIAELRALYRAAPVSEETGAAPEPVAADDVHLTDMGNSGRLVARHGPHVRWIRDQKRWAAWTGVVWDRTADGEVARRAKETALSIYDESVAAASNERADALRRWAKSSESAGKIEAMMQLARSDAEVETASGAFDQHPWLLNAPNGTIDLRTGRLSAHDRGAMLSKVTRVAYEPEAACPVWDAFLWRIFAGRAALIGFVQRAVGYALTGLTTERVMFILYGKGRNGKSSFVEAIKFLMGDYGMVTPVETLVLRRDKGIGNDVARLVGARFVSTSETSEGALLDEAFIKSATGGDTLAARFLFAEHFEFVPQLKLWLATNHKPAIRGSDYAVWDRIRLIPFDVRIPEDEQDKRLGEKLRAEAPGILAWAVRGCLDWVARGSLDEPDEVRMATEEYRVDEDVVGLFLAECCVESAAVSDTATALYDAYSAWADRSGEKPPMTKKSFGMRLQERGFASRRNASRTARVWSGVRVMTAAERTTFEATEEA